MARKGGDGSVAANVYKFLIMSNMKKYPFSVLEKRFAREEDLKNLLSSDLRFWLGEIEQNSWEVRPKVQVELCYRYKTGDCHRKCLRLHLCNENLLSPTFCGRPCKHGFSHNINDAHNKRIADAAFPRYFKDNGGGKIKILRSSFPRLCKSFTEDGFCNKSFCGYLHICPEYIKERCFGTCKQATRSNISKTTAHNFTIGHNKEILQTFNLSTAKQDRPHLLANILVGNLNHVKQHNTETYNNTRSKNLSSSSMVDISKPSGGARKRPGLSMSLSSIYPLAEREIEDKKRPSIVSQQSGTSNTSNEPTEEFIFGYILNNSNGDACMSLDDILHNFENDQGKTETWIKNHSKSFRLTCDHDGGKKIHLCLENVLPCFDYWSNEGCNSTSCKMFHVCKKFLFRIQHSEISCRHDHFKEDVKENTLAIERNLESVSKEHLLMLLRKRFPFVCAENMTGNCLQDDLCSSIHICGDFIEGRCTKADGLCSHKHESGWTTNHTVEIMNSFHISVENYPKCIIYNENISMSRSTDAASKNELIADFNSLKDEGICYKFLDDACIKGSSCSLRHTDPRSPYLWQYYERNFWKDFPHHVNVELEKCFCEVAKTDFISQSEISQQLKITFSEPGPIWICSYNDARVDVRRLSTKSSILLEDDEDGDVVVGLTDWKWYWEKNKNVWEEYSGTVKSEDVEKSFLNKSTLEYIFETKEFKYAVRFKEMVQQNLGPIYFTKRKVRRRPVFKDIKSITYIRKSKDLSGNQFPSHWPKDIKNGDCISIQDPKVLKEILTNFLTSLGRIVDIISVKEVCNRIFHSKYMNTKQNFTERLGDDNMNEKMLYHGTSSDVAPKICVQNFDWRLNGKNATSFGQGSYFARDASYSDNYAKENETGEQCMFLAQVLVGKYTRGNSSMKRPPEDETNPGFLYDCCVNNVSNPSIFIIFERDQCYPKYLFKYKEKNLNNTELGFVPQHIHDLNVGMEIDVRGYGLGTIRWIDTGSNFRLRLSLIGNSKNIGVELKMPNGDTDGHMLHRRNGIPFYPFRCQPNHGIYVGISSIATAWR